MFVFSAKPRFKLLLLALLLLPCTAARPVMAHGSHGGGDEQLEAGEFDFTPLITIEGHGGFETNLDDNPKHYAIDGLFGGMFQWGLGNGGSLTIEAAVGPSVVWGEAEHFYGKVHVHDDHGHEDEDHHDHHDHDDHAGHEDDHDHHDEHAEDDHHDHEEHADHDHHDDHDDHHDQYAEDDHHEHAEHAHDEHGHGDPELKRTDVRGFFSVRYEPNDRLSLTVDWMPYYVTRDQGDDIQGLKNELGAEVVWAVGDGDVDFALGDGLENILDGVFLSVMHRQGWESDGTWMGNYTDPRLGVGFNIDQLNVTIDAGPRFYTPGSYSGLSQRTDFAGEVEVSIPVGDAVLFAHWKPTYSPDDAPGWGEGWQHHLGTGVTFSF
ncbi:putative conserved secreted protein [Synechococcus sp. A18-40]|nr:putative conserved secreted protein [Synechococcus sp. A18-40]